MILAGASQVRRKSRNDRAALDSRRVAIPTAKMTTRKTIACQENKPQWRSKRVSTSNAPISAPLITITAAEKYLVNKTSRRSGGFMIKAVLGWRSIYRRVPSFTPVPQSGCDMSAFRTGSSAPDRPAWVDSGQCLFDPIWARLRNFSSLTWG